MQLAIEESCYDVRIERKRTNKHTYLRVKPDLTILVTTTLFTSDRAIEKILRENVSSLQKMVCQQKKKEALSKDFYYLGKKYDLVYMDTKEVTLGETKLFCNHAFDADKWYRRQAEVLFQEHLDRVYERFTEKIPYPTLKIRKMTSRWGVCNTKRQIVTLNLELIKRDLVYLDYVIVHELSHLVVGDHSKQFWQVVKRNCPSYQSIRKEMKAY